MTRLERLRTVSQRAKTPVGIARPSPGKGIAGGFLHPGQSWRRLPAAISFTPQTNTIV